MAVVDESVSGESVVGRKSELETGTEVTTTLGSFTAWLFSSTTEIENDDDFSVDISSMGSVVSLSPGEDRMEVELSTKRRGSSVTRSCFTSLGL